MYCLNSVAVMNLYMNVLRIGAWERSFCPWMLYHMNSNWKCCFFWQIVPNKLDLKKSAKKWFCFKNYLALKWYKDFPHFVGKHIYLDSHLCFCIFSWVCGSVFVRHLLPIFLLLRWSLTQPTLSENGKLHMDFWKHIKVSFSKPPLVNTIGKYASNQNVQLPQRVRKC